MNVNGVNNPYASSNSYGTVGTNSVTSIGVVGTPSVDTGSAAVTSSAGATTTSISAGGQFFSKMQQLSQQDPAEFKAVAADVATSFQQAASQASGAQAKSLTDLASLFAAAAQTGSLQPTPGSLAVSPGAPDPSTQVQGVQGTQASTGTTPHHHHHHGGIAAAQSPEVQQALQNAMSIFTEAQPETSSS